MNELIQIPRCQPTPNALELAEDLTITEWASIGRRLRDVGNASLWWVGDWRNHADDKLTAEHSEAVTTFLRDEMGYCSETVRRAAYVARKIPCVLRFPSLTFSHHAIVAKLTPSEQKKWLTKAEKSNWTRQELNAALRASERDPDAAEVNEDADDFFWDDWIRVAEKGLQEHLRSMPLKEWKDELLVERINQVEEIQKPLINEAKRRNIEVGA